jgi:hypothetical protein
MSSLNAAMHLLLWGVLFVGIAIGVGLDRIFIWAKGILDDFKEWHIRD